MDSIRKNISRNEAGQIYDLLVSFGGATLQYRDNFIQYLSNEDEGIRGRYEYRFQGKLGFGGKLRFDGHRLFVECYEEDRTAVRDDIISDLNTRLDNGPAIELANGYKFWLSNGKLHREDGPAIELADGEKIWVINGVRFNKTYL